jgi:hypothetical protein
MLAGATAGIGGGAAIGQMAGTMALSKATNDFVYKPLTGSSNTYTEDFGNYLASLTDNPYLQGAAKTGAEFLDPYFYVNPLKFTTSVGNAATKAGKAVANGVKQGGFV